jgi:hypothetical protein
MSLVQHAEDCPDHAGCTVIVGVRGDRVIWRSHMRRDIPVGVRLNIDDPVAGRHRWSLASPEHAATIGIDPEQHRRLAFDATARDLFTQQELAAIRDVLGVTAADLQVEANEKGWDRDTPETRRTRNP